MPQYLKSDVTILVKPAGLLRTKRIVSSRMHCSTPTDAPHLRCTSLTRTIPHSLRATLSQIYRSLLTLSANHNCAHFQRICFVILSSQSSPLFSMFVFDILQITSGCCQTCSECSACMHFHRFGYGSAWDRTRGSVLTIRRLTARNFKHKRETT